MSDHIQHGLATDKEHFLEKNVKKLMLEYRQNFSFLCEDLKLRKEKKINERILSVDFSEIFSYIFYTKTLKSNYKVLDYVFNADKDCKIVLTPPSVFEIINYYRIMDRISAKYSNYKELLKIEQVQNYFTSYNNYYNLIRKGADQNDPELGRLYSNVKTSYNDLINYGEDLDKVVGSLAFLLEISTPMGSELLLDKTHTKLIELIKNNKIMSLDVALKDSKIDIGKIATNFDVYVYMKNYLDRERMAKGLNNIVDAELAGLSAGFNDAFNKKNQIYMNVFTGSLIPKRGLLELLRQEGRDLPRCPMYGLIRFYMWDKLDKDYDEMYENALNGMLVLDELINNSNIVKSVKEKLPKEKHDSAISLLTSAYDFMGLLFYENNLSDGLLDASRSINFNDKFINRIEEIIDRAEVEESNMSRISDDQSMEMIAKSLADTDKGEENLNEAHKKIKNNLDNLYVELYGYLEKYDFNKLSPAMYNYYRIIKRGL